MKGLGTFKLSTVCFFLEMKGEGGVYSGLKGWAREVQMPHLASTTAGTEWKIVTTGNITGQLYGRFIVEV